MGAMSDRVYFNSVVLKVWSLDQQYQLRSEHVRSEILEPCFRPNKSDTEGGEQVGISNLYLNIPSRGFLCPLKFENTRLNKWYLLL